MRVIVLAGYKNHPTDQCPWIEKSDGVALLERRLREVRSVTDHCIVVLSGDSADEILRHCPTLENCELVFDTNQAQISLLSNLRAALKLGGDPAIVLPADIGLSPGPELKELVSSAVQQGLRCPYHLLQGVTQSGALWNGGFPVLLTTTGAETILREKELTGLSDPRLQRQEIAIPGASLASGPNHL